MHGRIPFAGYIPTSRCAICQESPCDLRTGSTHGTFSWCPDGEEFTPPAPGEDLLPWLHGPERQPWWDRVAMRGVA